MCHRVEITIGVCKRYIVMGLVSLLKCLGGVPMIEQHAVGAGIIIVSLNVFFVLL